VNRDYIYLDHAAATPMDPLVVEAMLPYFSEKFFNPSSPYAPAIFTKREYQQAKSRLARCLGVMADELIMTAGATESINLAFNAAGGVSLISAIEHDAVINSAKARSEVKLIQSMKNGRIDPQLVKKMLTPDVSFISIALVNHELGYIQPIEEIAEIIKTERLRRQDAGESTPLVFHTDASQAAALIDVKIKRLGVDLLTLSAAKVYGPKQVGLLWVRPGVTLTANILGGGQELGLRSGTENVAGVVGFATALELAQKRRSAEVKRLRKLREELVKDLRQAFPEMVTSSDMKKSLVSFLNISFPGLDAERLIFLLESRGVLVATGSACAANSGTRSHVLSSIGLSESEIGGSLRLTLGKLNNEDNIKLASQLIIEAVRLETERVSR
jgi:aminotransferase, class V